MKIHTFEELLQSEDRNALIENGISFHSRGENDKAAKFFRRAAKLGSTTAMNRIGILMDKKLAVNFYRKAAGRGDRAAMYKLGEIYEFGYGVEVDKSAAYYNYQEAATFGNVIAMSKVALDYENQYELDKAVDWYTLAADFGNEFAKNRLKVLSKVVYCKRNVEELKKNCLKKFMKEGYEW